MASAAHAQIVNSQLQAFTRTPFYAGLISRGLSVLPAAVFQKCPTLRSPGSQIIELTHVVFAQDGYPTSGEWKQRFPVSGCGNDTTLNFYFSATASEKVNTTVGIPGETRADLRLQRDAQRYAIISAGLVAKSCGNFDMLHSTFDGTEAPSGKLGILPRKAPPPWSETWILQGCGKRVAVPLRFVPDATGTQIIQRGASLLP